jgi:hypothetical protein
MRIQTLTNMHKLRRSADDGEEGAVLIMVLFASMVLTALVTGLLGMTIQAQSFARRRQDFQGALQAAQAGVDDYLTRLNYAPANYWATADPSNLAFTSWVPVSGSSNGATFRYAVNTSQAARSGVITVTSSGKVNDVVRTVRDTLKVTSFADFLYFTEYETLNPRLYPEWTSQWRTQAQNASGERTEAQARASCGRHSYDPGPGNTVGRANWCADIVFVSGDVLNGRVHSNDQFKISGSPTFGGLVETGGPAGVWRGDQNPGPNFAVPGSPTHLVVPMPAGNDDLLVAANTPDAGAYGCVYEGATRVRFVAGDAGYMYVTSPNTTSSAAPRTGCYTSLPMASEQRVKLPANGVLYVNSSPIASAACITQFQNRAGDITQYPTCRNGDVFVEGELAGQLTIGANNNIVVTNNITYSSSVESILGLIARNAVEIYHPVRCTGGPTTCTNMSVVGSQPLTNIEVNALIMSAQDSFGVQKFHLAPRLGTLTVRGGMIMRYRGAVGLGGNSPTSGYLKSYQYDERLRALLPPHFTPPGVITWSVAGFSETAPKQVP